MALQQVIKRHSEVNPTTVSTSVQQKCALLKQQPEPPSFKKTQCSELVLDGAHFSLKASDNCVQLKYGNIAVVRNFIESDGNRSICGQFFRNLGNLYTSKLPSSELGIFRATGLSMQYSVGSVQDIRWKCVCLQYNQGHDCKPETGAGREHNRR